jgi:gluconate 2-dehydrogenase gamma chain
VITGFAGLVRRRNVLVGTASLLALAEIGATGAQAREIAGKLPGVGPGSPPQPITPGGWQFFTPEEGPAVEAIVDRLIPPDADFAGGKDAGCAVYIDRQLAGPFGSDQGLYVQAPFVHGTKQQGLQTSQTPAAQYRAGLRAIEAHCRAAYLGKIFRDLPAAEQDRLLGGLTDGTLRLPGIDGKSLFALMMQNTMEGFLADPSYGGNRDLVGWRMIGFPGTRYDYRDWIERHNEPYTLPPVGLSGRPAWSARPASGKG